MVGHTYLEYLKNICKIIGEIFGRYWNKDVLLIYQTNAIKHTP
jgi:hypothetical protein